MNSDTKEKIKIRRARLKDLEYIFKIQQETRWIDKEDKEWLQAFLKIRSTRRLVLVAEDISQKSILGFLSAYKFRERAYIDTIAINREHRGKGIGSLLLKEAENILRERGVRVISLSVKKENSKALDFYLLRDYSISKVVLILEARITNLKCSKINSEFTVRLTSPARIRTNAFKKATWWSTLIEPVDRLIYKKIYKKEEAIIVLRKKRVKGFAEFSINSYLDIDNVGISSYLDKEILGIIICEVAKIGMEKNIEVMRIYVDSSKTTMIKDLEEMGFRVVDGEFLLEKELEVK